MHGYTNLQHGGDAWGQQARRHGHPQRRLGRIGAAVAQHAAVCNQIAADEDFDLVAHPGEIDPPEDSIGRHGGKRQQVARAP
ncbi:MAG: hypothetical protein A2710_16575 [Burkholderiales bacterium RIFCSPHIGHO2_01_FULL_64_960]|nr:MAG: hypothetical protein A2710_16575 [Burkholderiales bacterium RIFCSPHIGHO2_01_FULL_64_960]